MMCEEAKNESILIIYLVICGDHVKVEFIESINTNENFTSGRNITRIFRLAHFQCKKYNGEILGNKGMAPIWNRLKNIFDGIFLG